MTSASAALERRKAKVREVTGKDTEVQQLLLDLTRIDNEGLFVNVVAGGMSSLTTRLSFEALGIKDVPRDLVMEIGSPSIGLLPKKHRKAISSPVAQGYALIRRSGIPLMVAESFFGRNGHRFIPWLAFQTFEREFTDELQRLEDAKSDALSDYEQILSSMSASFSRLATEAQNKLVRQGHQPASGFRQDLVDALMAKVPSREHIETGIFLRREIGVLMLGSELTHEREATAASRLRELETRGHIEAREGVIRARVEAAQVTADKREQAIRDEIEAEAAAKEHMRQLKYEAAKEKVAGSLSPIQEGATVLGATLNKIATEMLTSIRDNGFIHANTAKKAREMGQWFHEMNSWLHDEKLEEATARLSALASEAPEQRREKLFDFDEAVTAIIAATRDAAQTASQSDRFAALEF